MLGYRYISKFSPTVWGVAYLWQPGAPGGNGKPEAPVVVRVCASPALRTVQGILGRHSTYWIPTMTTPKLVERCVACLVDQADHGAKALTW